MKTRRAQKSTDPRPALRPRRRSHARPVRRLCLDLAHREPGRRCPYCDPSYYLADDSAGRQDLLSQATRTHAEIAAEDAEGWGWVA